ncbi:hypothetical protein OIU78_021742 [Salix suchowensis]|nr:hypothetical protein OIU78_021742 [Salix suchowensis]
MHPKEDWVLCRVFHKCRAEDYNAKFSPQFMLEATANSGTVNLAASPLSDHQTLACGYQLNAIVIITDPAPSKPRPELFAEPSSAISGPERQP